MRKGRDGGEKMKKKENEGVFSGHYVIASSLPPERLRPNDDRWNATRSCQLTLLSNTCYQTNVSYYMVFVAFYLSLAICYFMTDYFYLKLAITCKNLFPFAPVVRLVIFLYDFYKI